MALKTQLVITTGGVLACVGILAAVASTTTTCTLEQTRDVGALTGWSTGTCGTKVCARRVM